MTDSLLKPPAPVPEERKKVGVLGKGDPECVDCKGPLGDDGYCPACEPGDQDTEIEL